MKKTCHSEYGQLKSVFIKSVTTAFVSDEMLAEQWRGLNYLFQPDFEKAILEYQDFEKIFKQNGTQLYYLPQDESAACTVLEYEGAEISVKGGGGPTCLTRPIWRQSE